MSSRLEKIIGAHRALADRLDERLERLRAPRPVMAKAHDHTHTPRRTAMDTPLSFESPESSTIASASYDPAREVLTIQFKRKAAEKGKGTYTYKGFPGTLWVKFSQAESKGQFFARGIRPYFTGEAVAA